MMVFKRLIPWFKVHYPLVGALLVWSLLLAKNPFSVRTLIPNFDPFPDTFHYIVPPRCFLMGQGWKLCRAGFEGIKPEVPPLYSVTMLPFLVTNNDPRMFYFANIGLSLTSLVLFYLILRQFTKNPLILGLVLFVYVTNYFIYWYPTLAMAENAILPLFMIASWLVIKNIRQFRLVQVVVLFVLAIAFYFTKPAFAPMTIVFGSWALFLLLRQWPKLKPVYKRNIVLMSGSLVVMAIAIEHQRLFWAVQQLFRSKPTSQTAENWFSVAFIPDNLPRYAGTLLGKNLPFLWDQTPMLINWLAISSLAGLISMVLFKKTKLTGLFLVSALCMQILFISSFYAVDGRYIYIMIPIMLLGLCFGLEKLRFHATSVVRKLLFIGLLAGMSGLYLFQNGISLKNQIMLNLRYAEQPWWHLSVVDISTYFAKLPVTEKKPFLIVAHPPFLFDFYGNDRYALLPLTQMQDFRQESRRKLWGEYDYNNYNAIYTSLLTEGHPVYVTNYGLGNDKGYHADFESIQANFEVELVQTGCYNLCNIYTVKPKP